MDVLGDILRMIKLRGSIYFNACFCSPWGMTIDKSNRCAFHLVVRGKAWLKVDSREKLIPLSSGDIVLFPQGIPHVILESPDSKCLPGKQVVEAYQNGETIFNGDKDDFNIVCGYVEFDRSSSHPFLDNLPEFIHINAQLRKEFYWLDNVLNQIVLESQHPEIGSAVLIDKFTEILFIQVIRTYAQINRQSTGYLSALNDKQLSSALSLIHNEPDKEWSVESLASEVGLSRSSFYTRFNDYIGISPMRYLFEWRMLKAKEKLENTQKPISLIAEEVGYQSSSAFQKAFKRFFQYTPASLRKGVTNKSP